MSSFAIRGRARGAILAAVVATLSVGVLSTPAHAAPTKPAKVAAPTSPYTAFTADVPAVDSTNAYSAISEEIDQNTASSSQPPTLTKAGAHGVRFDIRTDDNQTGSFQLTPPSGSSITPGTYPLVGAISNDGTKYQAVVGETNATYNNSGTVTVTQYTEDASGNPTTFAASYAMFTDAGSTGTKVTGEVRFNSNQPYAGRTIPQGGLVTSGLVGVYGADQSVVVTGAGPTPITFGASTTMSGLDPTDFGIRSTSTCPGATLNYGDTCRMIIRPQAREVGSRTAILSLTDNTAAGKLTIPLSLTGANPGAGSYHPLPSARLLDTRVSHNALRTGNTLGVVVGGRGGVPSAGVSSVVLNVTVVSPSSAGYLTISPHGQARPTASNLNFARGWTGANMVTVRYGTADAVDVYNYAGTSNVVIDVIGYYAADERLTASAGLGSVYRVSSPAFRDIDTRTSKYGPLPGRYYLTLSPDYGPEITPHITAFAVNITAVNPGQDGYLSAWAGEDYNPPKASTLNFKAHTTVSNMAIVPTAYCGDCGDSSEAFSILNNSNSSVHLVVDIVGFFDDGTIDGGLRFHPIAPTRIVDTRKNQGTHPLGPTAATQTGLITPPKTVAIDDTYALVQNVTAVAPTSATYLTLWPDYTDEKRPISSNVNPGRGQTVANAAMTEVGGGNRMQIFNYAGRVDVVADVSGRFDEYPSMYFGGDDPAAPGSLAAKGASKAAVTAKVHVTPVLSLSRVSVHPAG